VAFDFFQKEENEQDGQAQQPMQQLGQESPVVTGNQPQGEAGKSSSGSFTNLNSYLDANKSHQFGQEVAGKVGAQINEADQAQGVADASFRSAVDQTSVAKDDGVLGQLKTDPTKVDQSAFGKMRDAQYKGPNNLVDQADLYQPAQQKTDRAFTTAEQTKDEGGRKAFLNQEYGSGVGRYDYSKGQQKLDNLLVQADPNSKAMFEQNQARAAATRDKFGSLNTALSQYASGKKAATEDARASARSAVGIDDSGNWNNTGAMGDVLSELDRTVANQRTKLAGDRAALEPTLDKQNVSDFSPEAMQRLGVSKEQFQGYNLIPEYLRGGSYEADYKTFSEAEGSTYGFNPRDYIELGNDADLNRSTMADGDTQARISALSKLAGKENSFIVPDQAGRMVGKPTFTARGGEMLSASQQKRTSMMPEQQAVLARVAASERAGGQTATDSVRREGNAIRAKYGLPPI